jgi:uncharacterized protein YbdZ (MbtH family)
VLEVSSTFAVECDRVAERGELEVGYRIVGELEVSPTFAVGVARASGRSRQGAADPAGWRRLTRANGCRAASSEVEGGCKDLRPRTPTPHHPSTKLEHTEVSSIRAEGLIEEQELIMATGPNVTLPSSGSAGVTRLQLVEVTRDAASQGSSEAATRKLTPEDSCRGKPAESIVAETASQTVLWLIQCNPCPKGNSRVQRPAMRENSRQHTRQAERGYQDF